MSIIHDFADIASRMKNPNQIFPKPVGCETAKNPLGFVEGASPSALNDAARQAMTANCHNNLYQKAMHEYLRVWSDAVD